MTTPGMYPAPGPKDRDPSRDGSYAGPPPTGRPSAQRVPMQQIPMLTAHKPGIVPLRPLELGDILDGAIKAVRFNPRSMVGLSVLVLGIFLVPSAALGVGATQLATRLLSTRGPGAQAFVGLPAALLQTLLTVLATGILSGLLSYVVSQAVLGRKLDLTATWQSTRGRVLSLLVLALLSLLITLLSTALLIGPGVFLLFDDKVSAGVILLLLGVPGLIALSLFVSTKISMAPPAIVLEGHGVLTGLRRSFALTRGAAFWRVLGITLLAGMIAGVVGSILGLPFQVVGFVIAFMAGQDTENGQMVITFISHLSALLSGAITTPFVAAVTGLLYIDRRMRLEALDVVLLREAQTNPAPRN